MGIGSDQGREWIGEPLEVYVVTDPVAGPGENGTVLRGHPLEEEVVLGILVVQLDHVVIDVLHDQRDPDAVHPELLELHPSHGAGGVLEEDLVDTVADRFAGLQLAVDQVLAQDLVDDVVRHAKRSLPVVVHNYVSTVRPVRRRPAS